MLGPLDIDCIRLRSVGQRRGRCQSALGPESSERLCGTDAPRPQRFVRGGSYWIPAGDTEVRDALCGTLARISTLRSAHAAALRCYLRRAVENRIDDLLGHAGCRQLWRRRGAIDGKVDGTIELRQAAGARKQGRVDVCLACVREARICQPPRHRFG